MTLSSGTILNNRYRIVKQLGQGGFGAVYRAWDLNLSAPCAVKENFDTSPEATRQFAREASMLANLHHPNLPRVTDHFSLAGQGQYLVMDYVEGQDLSEIMLQTSSPLPEAQVLNIAQQVCSALEYLHTRTPPIVHRDIKPANIRIKPDGAVMLVDFGIAKFYDPTLRTTIGARAVTPGYSPFEQYGQKPTDTRTDVYALGATLYAMLTATEPIESIERVTGSALPSVRQLNPAVSENTERTVLRAMQIIPNDRYQSIAELSAALQSKAGAAAPAGQRAGGAARPPAEPPGKPPSRPPIFQTAQVPEPQPAAAIAAGTLAQPFPTTPPVTKSAFKNPLVITGIVLACLVFGGLGAYAASELFGATPTAESVSGRVTNTPRSVGAATNTSAPQYTDTPTLPTEIPPTPTITYPDEVRTLIICTGQEPDSLYPYATDMLAATQVQSAFYDGPYDTRTYAYQPIIWQKMPSLADGDAWINTINVYAGDMVVDNVGEVVTLSSGTVVRPAGCRSNDCAITYDGRSALQMDQLTAYFSLLPGLVWSDGVPITSADEVYAFNLAADPDNSSSKYLTDRTASYFANDDLTTIWTGLPGYMDSTYFLNNWGPYPEHLWGQYAAADLLTEVDAQALYLGWGPYIFDEWVRGDHISMHRNPNYFRAAEGLPAFDYLVYRFIGEEPNTAIAMVLSGECDIIDQSFGLESQSELLLELQAAGQITPTFITGTVWEHADFNIRPIDSIRNSGDFAGWDLDGDGQGPFGDVRLRQAVAMCMDRQAVVDTVYYGQSITIDTYLPPEHPLFNPENVRWPYDPVSAGYLLDEIGWLDTDGDPYTSRVATGVTGVPDGTPLQFRYETTTATARQQATQIMAESALACGMQMDLGYYPAGEWFADGPDGPLYGRWYNLGQFAWLTGVDPACNLYLGSEIPSPDNGWAGQNNTGYSNPVYDEICRGAIQSLPGEEFYITNHLEAQRIFSEELPTVPLYLRLKLAATRPDMCNFYMDPTNNTEMWNIEEFNYGTYCP